MVLNTGSIEGAAPGGPGAFRDRIRLFEHVQDGVLLIQEERVMAANPAACRILDRPNCTGTTLQELFTPGSSDIIRKAMVSATGNDAVGPLPLNVLVSGEERVLSVYVSGQGLHGPAGAQLILHEEVPLQTLTEARTRSRMAEEVNRVLRQEIAEHRRTQEELRQSRRFARSLIDSSLDMIIAVDQEGLISEFNPAAVIRFGYETEEVLGRKARMLYADDGEHARIQSELNTHGVFAGEVRNKDREGREFTAFLAASRQYDENGKLLGSMGVSRDVTKAKRDEQALRSSEERYRDLFEHATDLIQSVDADGRFQYVNTTWRETLGYSTAEVEQLTIWQVIAPEEQDHCRAVFRSVMSGMTVDQLRTVFLTKDGRRVIVEGNTNARTVEGRAVATRSIFRDVTGIVEARDSVRRHEAKLRALFESSDHMFWTVDARIALTSFNRGYADMIERLYGARPELNLDLQRPRKRFASEAYHTFWEEKYAEAFAGKAVRFETDVVDAQGQRVCNEIFLSPVFGADGRVEEVFGVGHEITEQKHAEDQVRENSARLQAIFDNAANMMVWTMDEEFRITSCNEHFRQSAMQDFGVELGVGMVFSMEPAERTSGRDMGQLLERYKAAFHGKPQQFEAELVDKSGRTIWVENFINPIRIDGRVKEVSGLAYHITERKVSQRELLRSLHEKEVLLKEVHHRVKNNLQIISSILNLQGGYVNDDPRMLELLRDSQDRIRSMSFIHESLYQNKNFSSIDLADYIDGLSRNLMLSYSLTGRIALERDLEPVQLGLDQAIPCGLILNELISNALKHAFPSGEGGTIKLGLHTSEGLVNIRIGDDGRGLPAGFDEERDANLGLQLVHTLIAQLDGRIARTPGPGVGYLITFELPK